VGGARGGEVGGWARVKLGWSVRWDSLPNLLSIPR